MKKIGLISDTHGFLDPKLLDLLGGCDEIWHAGDIGNNDVLHSLREKWTTVRAVWGNADGQDVRSAIGREDRVYVQDGVSIDVSQSIEEEGSLSFSVEGLSVLMMHIGGYPGHYSPKARKLLERKKPKLFVCGHSHILRVIFDKQFNCLLMNPGACGKYGIQAVRTALRFSVQDGDIKDLEVIELQGGSRN